MRRAAAFATRRRAPSAWRLTVAAALLAAALFGVFVWLAVASGSGHVLAAMDRRVAAAFIAWRTPERSHLFWAVTLIGNWPVLAALSFSAVVLFAAWGRRGRAALIAVGLLIGWGISDGAQAIVGRPRPPAADALIALPTLPSMPSGHAFTTLVFLGLLVFIACRWRGRSGPADGGGARVAWGALLAAVVIVGLIGVSRIYLGVHRLSDVLGGWFLGGAWLALLLGVVWREARAAVRRPGNGQGARAGAGPGDRSGASPADRGAAGPGWLHALSLFFARRPPARPGVRVVVAATLAIICVAAVVVGAMLDPLLRDL